MTSETKPCAPATCKFCGTTASIGTSNCTSYERAIAKTDKHPCGCPWFDEESRAFFAKKHGPAQGQGHDAAAKIVEDRMIWWRNSSDERIRDGSENKFIADAIRALTARVEPVVTWQYEVELQGPLKTTFWSRRYSDEKPIGNRYQRNIRPLYATPPAETMREAHVELIMQLLAKRIPEACRTFSDKPQPNAFAANIAHEILALLPPDAGERG